MQFPRQAICSPFRRHRLPFFATVTVGLVLGVALAAAPRSAHSSVFFSAIGDNKMTPTLSSVSFPNGGDIPKRFTCDGEDVSPALSWNEVPAGTKSFALLADDPDAPAGNWNHWTLWNVPPESRGLPEGVSKVAQLPDGTVQGLNDFRKVGYNGPCPPPGKPHRYYFKLFALDAKLTVKEKSGKRELEAAMKGHVLAQAEWMGRYGRK